MHSLLNKNINLFDLLLFIDLILIFFSKDKKKSHNKKIIYCKDHT